MNNWQDAAAERRREWTGAPARKTPLTLGLGLCRGQDEAGDREFPVSYVFTGSGTTAVVPRCGKATVVEGRWRL